MWIGEVAYLYWVETEAIYPNRLLPNITIQLLKANKGMVVATREWRYGDIDEIHDA